MSENLKIQEINGKEMIYDPVRKKYVALTPEEWVRQQFLNYLLCEKKYPASLIAIERQLKVGSLSKRFDILIYKNAAPWMLVECKSESIIMNQQTLNQILAYQSSLKVKYLTITNGPVFHCFDIDLHSWSNELPDF
ncbi:MAG: type I restriction enzyme HsdR N-terminal domain-containing protein [Chitinophagaceae bacterium]|nr:type I restriction enzyme HsdR N-terminal domain-containing protein [Chitinophagaceae bacterium]